MEKVKRTPASLKKLVETFHMEILNKGTDYDTAVITVCDAFRPSLQLDYFDDKRLQILGKSEMQYLARMDIGERTRVFNRLMSYEFPALIVSRNLEVFEEMVEMAKKHGRTLLRTEMDTVDATSHIIEFLNMALAPEITRHGVLVNVYGQGVLMLGESGVGKSETAIELLKRGHQLVADDAVEIRRINNMLIGTAPEIIRHYVEIRGVGIIDVANMFGIGSVLPSKSIDLVVHLENWQAGKEYDRLGLHEEYTTILGVKVPSQTLPVRPGRNIAIIIEVAARNLSLKRMGFSAAKELDKRMQDMIRKRSGQGDEE